jgi:hypothetical protein
LSAFAAPAQRVELSFLGGYSFNKIEGTPHLEPMHKIRSGNFSTRLMLNYKYIQGGAGFEIGRIRGWLVDTLNPQPLQNIPPDIAAPYIITHLFANAKLNIDKDRLYFFAGPMLGRITANTEYIEAGNHRGWIYGGQAGVVFHLSETISIDLLHNMRFYKVDNTKYTLPSAWPGPFFRSYTVRMNNIQAGLRIRFRNENCCKAELPEE